MVSKPHDGDDGLLAPSSQSGQAYDLLSDILRFVQLAGEIVFTTDFKEGFDVRFLSSSAVLHVVQEGQLAVEIDGQPPLELGSGDVLVLPHPVDYRLRSVDPTHRGNPTLVLEGLAPDQTIVQHGEGATAARTISATFQFANPSNILPLLTLLPNAIHIARDADQSAVLIRDVAHFLIVETSARSRVPP